jgi:hypothetical protein
LCEYLDATDSQGASIWLQWTEQQPELAKVIWPVVARLARQEHYFLIPEILVLARNSTNATGLLAEVHRALADKYVSFGRTQQLLNNHAAAIEFFTGALELVPSCGEALVGRAESLTSLGKSDMASADLAHAQRLGIRH